MLKKIRKKQTKKWIVYILECGDKTLYTGITTNLPNRLELHRTGKGARYTRGRTPLSLVYSEECATRSLALKREYAIKQLPRLKKIALFRH